MAKIATWGLWLDKLRRKAEKKKNGGRPRVTRRGCLWCPGSQYRLFLPCLETDTSPSHKGQVEEKCRKETETEVEDAKVE